MQLSTILFIPFDILHFTHFLLVDLDELNLELEGSVSRDDGRETSGTVGYSSATFSDPDVGNSLP
jgi:hypothetical protein